MKRLLTDRVDRFGALGQAAADLLRAEGAALRSELEGNARRLLGILLLFLLALFAIFWALGALILGLVEVGALWLPRWAAALLLVATLGLVAWLLALIARRRMARLESPAETVRRRAEDYREWWERRLGRAIGGPGEDAGGGSPGSSRPSEPSPRPDA